MKVLSEQDLIKHLDKIKTREENKDEFWLNLKQNRLVKNAYTINENNLLIDMPNKKQRDTFILKYSEDNSDYFSEPKTIPDKHKEDYKSNKDMKYPDYGFPLAIVDIEEFTDMKDIYIGILKSMCSQKSDLRIKNLEDMEYRCLQMLKTLSVEMIIINYSGSKLMQSKKINSLLYSLCKLSDLLKITINTVGSISPSLFYNESRKVPIGNFCLAKGENNSNDVKFATYTYDLKKGTRHEKK